MRQKFIWSFNMHPLRRHVSIHKDKHSALQHFHDEVVKRTESLVGHTFFEIVCPAPAILEVQDIERYAAEWVRKGWSADVVNSGHETGGTRLSLRLRSYLDAFPY